MAGAGNSLELGLGSGSCRFSSSETHPQSLSWKRGSSARVETQLPAPHQAGQAPGGLIWGRREQRGLPSEKGGEGRMDIPLWVLGMGDQQGRGRRKSNK